LPKLPKLVIAGIGKPMMEAQYSLEHPEEHRRVPEARYAYYRRCQVFRRGGEQCKAPAEKGSLICYAHAGQLATAVRRERERRAVLEEAVAQMRRRGRPECEMADLFMDFKGINVTLAVMAQALIDGRIDCKTAGRLVVQLQTVSKLLWLHHRGHRGSQRTATALTTKDTKEHKESPQIYADERRLGREKASTTKDTKEHEGRKNLPLINTDNTDLKKQAEERSLTAEARRHSPHQARTGLGGDPGGEEPNAERNWAANERERTRMALVIEVLAIANRRGWAHAPPELLRAA